ncbi:MAG: alpha-mannosidase, partial [Byssovorax cruenta]
MYHKQRWTPEKIKQRIELIAPLVYIKRKSIFSFFYRELDGALLPAPVGVDIDDSRWQEIYPHDYWGPPMQNFVLRTEFVVPDFMDARQAIALHLPLGIAGDFSHPEALAYIDGMPYATIDRHHQEIFLKPEWADGKAHLLALHGWTGLGGFSETEPFNRLYLGPCAIVQIHQGTRD